MWKLEVVIRAGGNRQIYLFVDAATQRNRTNRQTKTNDYFIVRALSRDLLSNGFLFALVVVVAVVFVIVPFAMKRAIAMRFVYSKLNECDWNKESVIYTNHVIIQVLQCTNYYYTTHDTVLRHADRWANR